MIYIIRHGQTEKNKAKVLQGRSDVPLNDAGRQQAAEVRERFEREGISFDKPAGPGSRNCADRGRSGTASDRGRSGTASDRDRSRAAAV